MKDRKMEEMLESVEAPRVELPGAKAILRRRLIGAAERPRRRRRWPVRGALTALGAAAALMAAFWLLPPDPTASELIREMEAVYGRSMARGSIRYVRQLVRIEGREPFEEERWSDETGMKLRLLDRDVATGEILGHSIMDGTRVYSRGGDRVQSRRVTRLVEDPGEEPRRISTRVLVPRSEEGAPRRAIVVRDIFDPEEFARRSPADVVAALASAGNVDYEGTETDEPSGRLVHVLSRRIDAVSIAFEDPEDIPGIVGEMSRRMASADDSLHARERITVLADSSRVRRVTLVIDRNGEEIHRLEKLFLGEATLEDSPTIFDPDAHGLTLIEPSAPADVTEEMQ